MAMGQLGEVDTLMNRQELYADNLSVFVVVHDPLAVQRLCGRNLDAGGLLHPHI